MVEEKQREFRFTRKDFDFLRTISNQRTGIVVTDDKYDMFYSRLSRRVRSLGLRDFAAYCDYVRNDASGTEVLELVNAITTNLTAFFRENHHFDYLVQKVIPQIKKTNASSRSLKIWSAGCSTGEEPYSLAISLREAGSALTGWQHGILATDIDSNVLATAARGVYAQDRVKGMSPARLKRWFLRGKGENAGLVRVKPTLQELIQFGQLNLMDEWQMDEPLDVIFCRNVIIYFDKETKIRLIEKFARNLKTGGHLFVGHSESLNQISQRFELIGNTVYRKVA
ncbi:MAG: protein-glutamate O-methyltransferase [Gammaproteobacteria bacterium]|nr:protein-glutamate O-methyltransferase [Gammaproteobacteria bacterium]